MSLSQASVSSSHLGFFIFGSQKIMVFQIKECCGGKITFPIILFKFFHLYFKCQVLVTRIIPRLTIHYNYTKGYPNYNYISVYNYIRIVQSFSGPHTQWSLKLIFLTFDAYFSNKKNICPWGKLAEWSVTLPLHYHVLLPCILA